MSAPGERRLEGAVAAPRRRAPSCARAATAHRRHRHLRRSGSCPPGPARQLGPRPAGHHADGLVGGPLPPSRPLAVDAPELRERPERRKAWRSAFINCLIVTIPATVIPITIAAFAAYAFAWMRFPFRSTLFLHRRRVCSSCRSRWPSSRSSRSAPRRASPAPSWASGWRTPASACRLPIFLLYNFISQLPGGPLRDGHASMAPRTSRCSPRVVLPLSVPALAAFAIFQFLWVWNDLLVALVFLGATGQRVGHDRGAHASWWATAASSGTC